MVELEQAINATKSGKAPGIDGIPAEIFKHGGIELKKRLFHLMHVCWKERSVPQDFKDAI